MQIKKNAPPKRTLANQAKSEKFIKKDKKDVSSETNLKQKKNNLNIIAKSRNSKDDFLIPFQVNTNLKIANIETSEKSEKINAKVINVNKIETEETLKKSENEDNLIVDEYDEKFFEEYLSTDFDDMEFDDAVAKDKRKYCEHMKENLIEDQIILTTFVDEDKLKPRSIKILVFILHVILYFVVNGLFFSEEVISELYNIDEDEENFFSFIPRSLNRIIYCTLVSIAVGLITNFFFVDEKKIKGIFKRDKDDIPTLKKKCQNS